MSLPAVFIGHGSPLQAIEASPYTAAWQQLGRSLPRPESILVISAHWYTRGTGVTAMARPRTIHDFYGFPAPLYAIEYPAPGDTALAERVAALAAPTAVHLDQEWGLDHGSWSVLRHMYPAADIPVVQLSIDAQLPPRAHYELAARLGELRDRGVLLLGSGNVVHNLRAMQPPPSAPLPWARTFNEQVRKALQQGDHGALIDYAALGPAAQQSVPTPEHYLPLLYVLGVQRPGEASRVLIDGIELGAIGMLSVQVGE